MMKMFIILLIAAAPLAVFSQQPNGNHVIKVPGIGIEQLIRGFLDAGYAIEKSESSLSVIVTHLKETEKANVATQIKAKIQDGSVWLSGEYIEPGKDQEPSPITDTGTPGSPCKESWDILHTFAKSFNKPLEIL